MLSDLERGVLKQARRKIKERKESYICAAILYSYVKGADDVKLQAAKERLRGYVEQVNVMPNYAMQWTMIRWARDRGCTVYDFRGVAPRKTAAVGDDGNEEDNHLHGLDRFKEGFGAEYVEYLGELDLVFNKRSYWLWALAKPRMQRLYRLIRSRG